MTVNDHTVKTANPALTISKLKAKIGKTTDEIVHGFYDDDRLEEKRAESRQAFGYNIGVVGGKLRPRPFYSEEPFGDEIDSAEINILHYDENEEKPPRPEVEESEEQVEEEVSEPAPQKKLKPNEEEVVEIEEPPKKPTQTPIVTEVDVEPPKSASANSPKPKKPTVDLSGIIDQEALRQSLEKDMAQRLFEKKKTQQPEDGPEATFAESMLHKKVKTSNGTHEELQQQGFNYFRCLAILDQSKIC